MIGSELRELRKKLNLTQAELAPLLFVSVHTIQSWEIGRHPINAGAEEHAKRLAATVV